MTQEQIEEYKYCEEYLQFIKVIKEKIPFNIQKYGCGSKAPVMEHVLEKIHRTMWEDTFKAIRSAETKVNELIRKI